MGLIMSFMYFSNTVAGGPNFYTLNQTNFISDDGVSGKQLEIITDERLALVYPIIVVISTCPTRIRKHLTIFAI